MQDKKLTIGIIAVGAVVAVGAVGLIVAGGGSQPKAGAADIVSERDIHWHPKLVIFIKGQPVAIPGNIGIGSQYQKSRWYDSSMQMTDVHTHEGDGTPHWEVMTSMKGPVTRDHIRIGEFFEIWGQPFSATQILDKQNGSDGTVRMTVNGRPNTNFEKYEVRDKDKIEIRFE